MVAKNEDRVPLKKVIRESVSTRTADSLDVIKLFDLGGKFI
jgi:hypothetical protein